MPASPLAVVEPLASGPASREQLISFLIADLHLLSASYEARAQGRPPREAPVEFHWLRQFGVEKDVVLWLLFQGQVDHLQAGPAEGVWAARASAVVGEDSAFALTPLGEAFGEVLVGRLLVPAGDGEFVAGWRLLRVGQLTPRYSKEERRLTWGRTEVKRYRQPSGNQEMILLAAEELGWTRWFDDPLPRIRTGNPKARLHDAIKGLNRHQEAKLVRFRGDGTGTRLGWELR
jgi:hypothetical protein